jgi:hypothetical protein
LLLVVVLVGRFQVWVQASSLLVVVVVLVVLFPLP